MGCIEHCVDRQRRMDDLWGVRDDDGMSAAVHIVAAAVAVAVAADNNTLGIASAEAVVVDNYCWLRNQQQFASHQVHA